MDKLILIGLIILVFVVPLIFWHSTTDVYGLVKVVVFELLALVVFILWLIKNTSVFDITVGSLGWGVILFFLAMILSIFKALNIHEAFNFICQWGAGAALFFTIANTVKKTNHVKAIFTSLILAGLVASLYSVYENKGISFTFSRLSYGATFGNPVFFSQYLVVVIPLALIMGVGYFQRSKKLFLGFFYLFCAALMLLFLILTRSRGAYLGMAAAFFFLILACPPRLKRIFLKVICIIIVISVMLGLIFLPQIKDFAGKDVQIRNLMRIHVWKSTIKMIMEHPILGVGVGNFKIMYPLYRTSEERAVTPKGVKYSKAHNDFLQVWAEIGILGFLSMLWILFCLIRYCFFVMHHTSELNKGIKPWGILVAASHAAIIGLMVQALFNPVLQLPASFMCFWAMAGIIGAARIGIDRNKEVKVRTKAPSLLRIAICVTTILIIVFLPVGVARPLVADYYLEHASQAFSKMKLDEATANIDKSIIFYPHNLEAYFLQGRIKESMGAYGEAINSFKMALRLHPNYALVWNNLGIALSQAGETNEAVESFKKATEIKDDFVEAHYNLALLYKDMNEIEKSKIESEKVMELDPNFLGNIYLAKGIYDQASLEYHKAIRRDPENIEAYFKLGQIWQRQNLKEKATQMYMKAIELQPNYVEAHEALAYLYKGDGQYRKAIEGYKKALGLIPQAEEALLERISFLSEGGFFKQVLEEYEKVKEFKNKRISFLKHTGELYNLIGESEKSLQSYKELLGVSGDDIQVLKEVAAIYQKEGMYEDGLNAYRKALMLKPENKEVKARLHNLEIISAHHAMASLYLEQGLPQDAIAEYEKVVSIFPEDLYTLTSLANVYKDTGRSKDAEELLWKAIETSPGNMKLHLFLAALFRDMDRIDEAESQFKTAAQLSQGSVEPYLALGSIHRGKGDLEAAEEEYKKAVGIDPDNVQAHLALGSLLKERGRVKEAIKEFEEAKRIDPENRRVQVILDALRKIKM